MTATAAGQHDAPERFDELNRYSQVIVDEARRRGIGVEVLDPTTGELALTRNGRRVTTVESLSELTSAVAFRRCDHKAHTRRVLARTLDATTLEVVRAQGYGFDSVVPGTPAMLVGLCGGKRQQLPRPSSRHTAAVNASRAS